MMLGNVIVKYRKLMIISNWWVNKGNEFNLFTFWSDLLIWTIPISLGLALIIDWYVA